MDQLFSRAYYEIYENAEKPTIAVFFHFYDFLWHMLCTFLLVVAVLHHKSDGTMDEFLVIAHKIFQALPKNVRDHQYYNKHWNTAETPHFTF